MSITHTAPGLLLGSLIVLGLVLGAAKLDDFEKQYEDQLLEQFPIIITSDVPENSILPQLNATNYSIDLEAISPPDLPLELYPYRNHSGELATVANGTLQVNSKGIVEGYSYTQLSIVLRNSISSSFPAAAIDVLPMLSFIGHGERARAIVYDQSLLSDGSPLVGNLVNRIDKNMTWIVLGSDFAHHKTLSISGDEYANQGSSYILNWQIDRRTFLHDLPIVDISAVQEIEESESIDFAYGFICFVYLDEPLRPGGLEESVIDFRGRMPPPESLAFPGSDVGFEAGTISGNHDAISELARLATQEYRERIYLLLFPIEAIVIGTGFMVLRGSYSKLGATIFAIRSRFRHHLDALLIPLTVIAVPTLALGTVLRQQAQTELAFVFVVSAVLIQFVALQLRPGFPGAGLKRILVVIGMVAVVMAMLQFVSGLDFLISGSSGLFYVLGTMLVGFFSAGFRGRSRNQTELRRGSIRSQVARPIQASKVSFVFLIAAILVTQTLIVGITEYTTRQETYVDAANFSLHPVANTSAAEDSALVLVVPVGFYSVQDLEDMRSQADLGFVEEPSSSVHTAFVSSVPFECPWYRLEDAYWTGNACGSGGSLLAGPGFHGGERYTLISAVNGTIEDRFVGIAPTEIRGIPGIFNEHQPYTHFSSGDVASNGINAVYIHDPDAVENWAEIASAVFKLSSDPDNQSEDPSAVAYLLAGTVQALWILQVVLLFAFVVHTLYVRQSYRDLKLALASRGLSIPRRQQVGWISLEVGKALVMGFVLAFLMLLAIAGDLSILSDDQVVVGLDVLRLRLSTLALWFASPIWIIVAVNMGGGNKMEGELQKNSIEDNDQTVLAGIDLIKLYEIGGTTRAVVSHASIELVAGHITCLMGPSGSGKTTLMELMAGRIDADGGKVEVPSQTDRATRRSAIQKTVSFVPQSHPSARYLKPRDMFRISMKANNFSESELDRLNGHIRDFGLEKLLDTDLDSLSGGEQQLIEILCAACSSRPVLMIDEPTSHLDRTRRDMMLKFLRAQADSGKSILISTHDIAVAYTSNQLHFMDDGSISASVDTATATSKPTIFIQVLQDTLNKQIRSLLETIGPPEVFSDNSGLDPPIQRFGEAE